MKFFGKLCFLIAAIAGFSLSMGLPSAALTEDEIQESVLAPDEPGQSPDVTPEEGENDEGSSDQLETYSDSDAEADDEDRYLNEDISDPALPLDY